MSTEFFRCTPIPMDSDVRLKAIQEYEPQELMIGEFAPEDNWRVRVDSGRTLGPVLPLLDPFNVVISKSIYDALVAAQCTGWRGYNVDIEGVDKEYYGFQVLSRCGPVIRPETAGYVIGMNFDESTWDGSDFFCPLTTMTILCTQKGKDVLSLFGKAFDIQPTGTMKWYSTAKR